VGFESGSGRYSDAVVDDGKYQMSIMDTELIVVEKSLVILESIFGEAKSKSLHYSKNSTTPSSTRSALPVVNYPLSTHLYHSRPQQIYIRPLGAR
jgi:hypothetical protein